MELPKIEINLEELANKILDEFEYKGMTIRGWADRITSGEYQLVKNGHWYHDCRGLARCSVCGEHEPNGFYTYCPSCGAKMDLNWTEAKHE